MAQRVVTTLIDDLDGSPADRTVTFSVGPKHYTIDLNATHIEEFEKALGPYITAATKLSGGAGRGARPRSTGDSPSASDIREWAEQQGLPVSPRGRISTDLRDRYLAAH